MQNDGTKNEKIDEPILGNVDNQKSLRSPVSGISNKIEKAPLIEINRFFNELPIRIVGTQEFPVFYAEDIGKILNLKRIRNDVRNFGAREIVSPEQRQKYGIVTYKRDGRKDSTKILLTEFGAYRLIMSHESQLGDQLRDFVYDVLHELRTKGVYEVKQELEKLKIVNEQILEENNQLKKYNDDLLQKQQQFQNLTEKLYVLEIANDPRKIIQQHVLPADKLDDDSDDEFLKYNSIDDWDLYCKMFPNPDDRTPPYTYKITIQVTADDRTRFNLRYEVYTRDARKTLELLDKKLYEYKVNSTPNSHYYECRWEVIRDTINGIIC